MYLGSAAAFRLPATLVGQQLPLQGCRQHGHWQLYSFTGVYLLLTLCTMSQDGYLY
ncbi:hypothetical protein HMPREF9548_00402 [Escherichia coli MS 182-1]|nr:hypothetical protein HMPREF9548_00402 [Escherichia coli MS 182-1]